MELDLIIIGAGPAGVSAAIYAKRAGLNFNIFEAMGTGGQVREAGLIENYPGFDKVNGIDLANEFAKQLKALDIKPINEEVINIKKDKIFEVTTKKNTYFAKSVIIATGASPRKLNLENENKLIGQGVSYCAYCDGAFFNGETIAIVGAGNSACEAALYLSKIGKKIFLISNTDKLYAEKVTQDLISKTKNIEVIYNANIIKLNEANYALGGIRLTLPDKEIDLYCAALFIYIGHTSNASFLKENFSKLLTDKGDIIATNTITAIPGLYVAGDVSNKKIKQIVTATADGAIALINALNYLKTI